MSHKTVVHKIKRYFKKPYNIVLAVLVLVVATFLVAVSSYQTQRQAEKIRNLRASSASTIAFPGAVGFGASSIGGRGGTVCTVTSLNNSGDGTLRDCVSKSGPRVVIFKVSGTIQLTEHIKIDNPYIYIAGQTSPGGIQLKGGGIKVRRAHDVIVRGLMVRPGNETAGAPLSDRSGLIIYNDADSTQPYNVVFDHNSVEWTTDEVATTWEPTHHITFSNNILAQALNCAGRTDSGKECHPYGPMTGESAKNITFYGNLIANNSWRNPSIHGNSSVEVINNLLYSWGAGSITVRTTAIVAPAKANYVNIISNFAKSTSCSAVKGIYIESATSDSRVYSDNWTDVSGSSTLINTIKSITPAFPGSGITPLSASNAYNYVLTNAGALRGDRVDDLVKTNVRNGTLPNNKCYIDSQTEVGGWPTFTGTYPLDSDNDGLPNNFELAHGTNNTSLSATELSPSGFMWIEEYANSFYSGNTVASSTPVPTISGNNNSPTPIGVSADASSSPIIINYASAGQFNSIPSSVLGRLTSINSSTKLILVRHASVGTNISTGLTNLADSLHGRANFVFQSRGNPGWKEKVDDFVTQTTSQINGYDIFTMKFCYIDNVTPSTIWNYYRDKMLYLEQRYPSKKFVWWTMPITIGGNANRDGFNTLVRNYSRANNKILFDIADIESKGGTIKNGGYEALYDEDRTDINKTYTSDGGHLNSTGSNVVAKAFWVMMAKVYGWNSAVTPTPTPRSTATVTPRPTSTPTPRPTATVTPRPTLTPTPTSMPIATVTPGPTVTGVVTSTLTPTVTPMPDSMGGSTKPLGYKAEYFANDTLNGNPSIIRYEKAINFDWGTRGSPDSSIKYYYFSARWTKTENFEGGKYRFSIRHNQGSRIYVDNKLIYNNWDRVVKDTLTLDHYITPGSHTLRIEYREEWGDAYAHVSYKKISSETNLYIAEYFGNITLEGTPVVTRYEENIAFDWGSRGSPSKEIMYYYFSARWIKDEDFAGGNYQFTTRHDHGMRIYIDGKSIYDKWGSVVKEPTSFNQYINAGTHTIKVEYREKWGDAYAHVSYQKLR